MAIDDTTDLDPALRICEPGDLAVAVPYLLGFHPEQSLVVVALSRRRLVVTMRLDLADAATPALAEALGAAVRAGADEVVGVVYSDLPAEEEAHQNTAMTLGAEAAAQGLLLGDLLVVRDGRVWSLQCRDLDCPVCPVGGAVIDSASSRVAAAATYLGLVALPRREDLVAALDPLDDARRDALVPLIEQHENAAVQAALEGHGRRAERSARRAILAAARAADERAPSLSDERVARFGVALTEISVRDAVWMAVDAGRVEGRSLWHDLARRLPSPYDAAPLFLVGWTAWRAGNGALAGAAAERALAGDPTYSAANLLLAALARGVDPRQLPPLRAPKPPPGT